MADFEKCMEKITSQRPDAQTSNCQPPDAQTSNWVPRKLLWISLKFCQLMTAPVYEWVMSLCEWAMSHIWMSLIVLSGLAEGALHRVANSQQRERARARARARESVCVWERRIHRHTDTKADTDAATEADMQTHIVTLRHSKQKTCHTLPHLKGRKRVVTPNTCGFWKYVPREVTSRVNEIEISKILEDMGFGIGNMTTFAYRRDRKRWISQADEVC